MVSELPAKCKYTTDSVIDRVFSTMGIPACLWRRTGEIYKGNKEFAELVGVPIESLRDGKLAIYELMEEGPSSA